MFDGARVKSLRNRMNISANTLAKAVGVSHSYISLVEIGHRIPTKDTQTRLAKFFGCDIEVLQLKMNGGDEKNVIHVGDSNMKAKQFYEVDESGSDKKIAGDLDGFNVEIIFQLVKDALSQVTHSAKILQENPPSFTVVGKVDSASIHGGYQVTCTREHIILGVNTGENGLAWFKRLCNYCPLPEVILRSLSHGNETLEFVWFTEYTSLFSKILFCRRCFDQQRVIKIVNHQIETYF